MKYLLLVGYYDEIGDYENSVEYELIQALEDKDFLDIPKGTIITAKTGEEALRVIESEPIGAVIVNYNDFPGGEAFLEELKDTYLGVPFFIISYNEVPKRVPGKKSPYREAAVSTIHLKRERGGKERTLKEDLGNGDRFDSIYPVLPNYLELTENGKRQQPRRPLLYGGS